MHLFVCWHSLLLRSLWGNFCGSFFFAKCKTAWKFCGILYVLFRWKTFHYTRCPLSVCIKFKYLQSKMWPTIILHDNWQRWRDRHVDSLVSIYQSRQKYGQFTPAKRSNKIHVRHKWSRKQTSWQQGLNLLDCALKWTDK